MSSTDAFKLLEAGLLLAAGVAIGWWQLRDVAKAREATRRAAEERAAKTAPAMNTDPSPTPLDTTGRAPGSPHDH